MATHWTYDYSPNGDEFLILGPDNEHIATVGPDAEKGITGAAVERNARKIAALPEVLAALRLARQYVRNTHGIVAATAGEDNLISPDLKTVDDAIVKAEGRKS